MRKNILAALLMLFVFNAHAYGWTGNLNFFLGQKILNEDSDDLESLDEQPQFGLLLDFKKENWPVSLAIDYLSSKDDVTEFDPISALNWTFELSTTELDVGLRKIFDGPGSQIKPYVGGGAAYISAESEITNGFWTETWDDNGIGFWLNGGVYWTLGQGFNIGVDLRYSSADVGEEDADAGGTHVGLLLGFHW